MRAALEAAHRERDAHRARAYALQRAAKNRRQACAPTREELFANQMGLPVKESEEERLARRAREERRQAEARQLRARDEWFADLQRRPRRDEERMRRWYDARGAGLRDGYTV